MSGLASVNPSASATVRNRASGRSHRIQSSSPASLGGMVARARVWVRTRASARTRAMCLFVCVCALSHACSAPGAGTGLGETFVTASRSTPGLCAPPPSLPRTATRFRPRPRALTLCARSRSVRRYDAFPSEGGHVEVRRLAGQPAPPGAAAQRANKAHVSTGCRPEDQRRTKRSKPHRQTQLSFVV